MQSTSLPEDTSLPEGTRLINQPRAGAPIALAAPISSAASVRPGPLPRASSLNAGTPLQSAVLRHHNRDFVVDELFNLSDADDGQHCYLQLARSGLSTVELAKNLAHKLGVASADIGYAGMKDKFAVTRQWFSVPAPMRGAEGDVRFEAAVASLPQIEGDWHSIGESGETDAYAVTDVRRQTRKLRRGDHAGNQFSIRLKGISLDDALASALKNIAEQGAPNYFGHQRFGNDGNNVQRALDWLPGQRRSRRSFQRGLHLSVLRAQLFNHVLSQRVLAQNWNLCLPGEDKLDGAPSGPMWGRGRLSCRAEAAELERACLLPWWPVALALEHTGLAQQRRALVARPIDLTWREEPASATEAAAVRVEFSLAPGSFATSILREIASFAGDLAGDVTDE